MSPQAPKTLEEKLGFSILQMAELARLLVENKQGMDKYKGVMYCLSILYVQLTGKNLDGTWGPKEVFAWAVSLGQRGSIQ